LHNVRLARDLGLMASSHVTKPNAKAFVPDGYERLAAMKLLGPDHNLVHCNHLTTEEIGRLLDEGCSVTCTSANELHDHPNPTAMMKVLAHGSQPSIGIDVEPMVTGDLWREMQTALLFTRIESLRSSGKLVGSHAALSWATTAGAKALMMEREIGALKPGMKADLIALRSEDLNLFPVHDPLLSVVEQTHSGNVDTVIVDGVVRKRHGRLLFDDAKRRALGEKLIESVSRLSAEAGYVLPSAGA
jgi:cytosine/adenosine deaminase-related metal-dependent hydrolase